MHVTGDKQQVERYCKRMNAGGLHALLAAVITQRPWEDNIITYDTSRYAYREIQQIVLKCVCAAIFPMCISPLLFLIYGRSLYRQSFLDLSSPFCSIFAYYFFHIIIIFFNRQQVDVRSAEAVILRSYVEKYFVEIVKLLGAVPSDLLLLFKTGDCLRHLDRILGSSVNSAAGKNKIILYSCFNNCTL